MRKRAPENEDAVSKHLLTVFDGLYQAKVGARYPINGGKDGKLLKTLRGIYTDEAIEEYMQAFFAMPDDFIESTGYSLGAFYACLPKVILWSRQGQQSAPKAHKGIAAWVARKRRGES